MTMIIINFSHPLTQSQVGAIESLQALPVASVLDVVCQLDNSAEFRPQVRQLVDNIKLTSNDWQTQRILIVPPGYAPATAVLLSELHGRMGYFPSLVRIRPSQDSAEPFEVAEIIDLRKVRDSARTKRE